jgi:palmitoyltransferase
MTDKNGSHTGCTVPELLLRIVLAGTLSHYETRGLIDEKRLEHMLHAGKQILYKSHQESDVRQVFAFTL